MRTLSRPMFNMGGPIKEGVMHGIREPYKGGQLVKPGPGRPGYAGEYTSGWNRIWGNAPQKIVDTTKKISQEAAKKANMFKGIFSKGIPSDVQIGRGIKNLAGKVGQWKLPGLGVTNPLTFGLPAALTAKYKYTQPEQVEKEYGISRMEKLLASSLPGGDQSYLPLALRGVFGERKIEVPEDRLKNITMEKGPPGGTQLPSYTDPNRATDLAKAAKDKRVNKLLEIMGHKKSKKDAVYNALIDASQIIGAAPGGKGLDISKDIIQPIIGATSKRFDKPKEIEEAVRLMQTKAEIEAGMPSTKLKDLIAIGIDTPEKQEAYIRTQLGQPTSFGMAKVAAGKNLTGDNAIDAEAAAYAPDTYQGRLIASKDFKEIKDKQKEKKESDIITEFTEKIVETKDYPDGDYAVGNTLVTVTEGKVSNIRR